MMPRLEQLFLIHNLGNVLPRSQINEVADSGNLVAAADNGEVSDLLDHRSSRIGAPLGRPEGITEFPRFFVEKLNDAEANSISCCREESPLYPRIVE